MQQITSANDREKDHRVVAAAEITPASRSSGDVSAPAPAGGAAGAPQTPQGGGGVPSSAGRRQRAWTTWPHGSASSSSSAAKTHLPHLAQAAATTRASRFWPPANAAAASCQSGAGAQAGSATSYGGGVSPQTWRNGGFREHARPCGAGT